MRSFLALLASCCILLLACKRDDGSLLPNLAPNTTISIKEITLDERSFLISSVRLFWSGTDQDGFIKGFQLSQDSGRTWSGIVSTTDSLFRFSFNTGTDTARISFMVRAIDQSGNTDLSPALITLPIRNSAPTAVFDADLIPLADTAFYSITLPFRADDADGNETIDSIFFRINNGPWVALDKRVRIISFLAQDPNAPGTQPAKVYLGAEARLANFNIPGIVVGGLNTFQVKVKDLAKAESNIATILKDGNTERTFYLKQKTSDLLVLDCHQGVRQDPSPSPEDVYNPILTEIYPAGIERIDMNVGKGRNQPRLVGTTLGLQLGLFKKIFAYMDDSRNSSGNRSDSTILLLETIAPVLGRYLDGGGSLLLTTRFPEGSARIARDSPIFGLIPADSISSRSGALRMNGRGLVRSKIPNSYPVLQNLSASNGGGTIDGVDVFYPSKGADTTYMANITVSSGTFRDSTVIGARRISQATGKPNFHFFSMELHRLSQQPAALKAYLNTVLNVEFN